ncbi:MAG: hypothetical protein FJX76_08965 [Armatimonadetes bacterium]|nr:hypothetical protein [Armatimonadota bacterium]
MPRHAFRTSTLFASILLAGLLLGCGSNTLVQSSGGTTTTTPTGTILVNHSLLPGAARRAFVGNKATQFVYYGLDPSGTVIYGPVTLPRAQSHVLSGVPITVVRLNTEYRATDGKLLGSSSMPVQVTANSLVEVTTTPSNVTTLQVQNSGNNATQMVVKLGTNPTQFSDLTVTYVSPTPSGSPSPTLTQSTADPAVAYLLLNPNDIVEITNNSDASNVLLGLVVAFETEAEASPPQEPYCPGAFNLFPNGVNYFECNINNGANNNETLDISCNQGANTYINVQCSSGPPWTDNVDPNNITSFANSFVDAVSGVDDNCCLPGVYPYGLSNCTATPQNCVPSPPFFTGSPTPLIGPFCTNNASHCNISREAGQNGGTVIVQYLGNIDLNSLPSPSCTASP